MGCGSSSAAAVSLPPPSAAQGQSEAGGGAKGSGRKSEPFEPPKLNFVAENRTGVSQGVGKQKHTMKIEDETGGTKEYKPLRRGSYSSNPTGTVSTGDAKSDPTSTANVEAVAAAELGAHNPPNPFVLQAIRGIMFLAHLEESLLERVSRLFELQKYAPDDFVIQQGHKGTHLYVVSTGKLKGWSADEPGKVYVTYSPGQVFGELTYLFPSKKTFLNITADGEPSEVYRIEHETLRKVISSWQILKMKKYDELISACDIFHKTPKEARLKLVELMNLVEYAYGDEIATCGAALPDHLEPESVIWIVEEGALDLVAPVDGQMTTVDTIGQGEYLPMFATDDDSGTKWTVTVSVSSPARVIVIERTAVERADPDLWRRCQESPESLSIVQRLVDKVKALEGQGKKVDWTPKTTPAAKWSS